MIACNILAYGINLLPHYFRPVLKLEPIGQTKLVNVILLSLDFSAVPLYYAELDVSCNHNNKVASAYAS